MLNSVLDAPRLSLTKAAQRLNLNAATVWRWASRGVRGRKLRTILVGGRRFVLVADLEDFLQGGQQNETQEPNPTIEARALAAGEELARRGF